VGTQNKGLWQAGHWKHVQLVLWWVVNQLLRWQEGWLDSRHVAHWPGSHAVMKLRQGDEWSTSYIKRHYGRYGL